MEDMYRNCKPPSLVTGLASDSEEVSTLFNQLLHSPSSSCIPLKTHQHQDDLSALPLVSPPLEFLSTDAPSGGSDVAVEESSSSFNFSDPCAYVSADTKASGGNPNLFFSPGVDDTDANTSVRGRRVSTSSHDNPAVLACNMEKDKEASELPSKPIMRSSSKRSRTAEVHNLSEKRRRSRINEKMKALQNLIPNSNKTDKASMLDEAIEYLKQLQLQVQMLSLRNGLSLHPMSYHGIVQPTAMPQEGLSCAGNGFQSASRGIVTLTGHVENNVEAAFNLSKEFVLSTQPGITSGTTTTVSDSSSSLHPPFRFHDVQIGHFLPTSSQ